MKKKTFFLLLSIYLFMACAYIEDIISLRWWLIFNATFTITVLCDGRKPKQRRCVDCKWYNHPRSKHITSFGYAYYCVYWNTWNKTEGDCKYYSRKWYKIGRSK